MNELNSNNKSNKTIFNKNPIVVVVVSLFWLVILLCFIDWTKSPEANITPEFKNAIISWIIIIWVLKILRIVTQKLVIEDDHLTIKKGIMIKSIEDIEYKKINNIEIRHFSGIGHLKIYTGNDKLTIFKYIDKPEQVKETINNKIHDINQSF